MKFQLIKIKSTNMIRYITSIFAVIIAVGAVAFTTPKRGTSHNPKALTYYFQFTGSHGDEADVTKWQEISVNTYDGLSCDASHQGCKIASTSVDNPSDPFPDREITSVTVNANDVPQPTMENFEVANKQ
ncbi:MAG TPA: hypothetical protein DIT07_15180 [Sphingobacteriaceae bacterium]|nr:hypothetical protein [Sphingobacteriaceae bacterium]